MPWAGLFTMRFVLPKPLFIPREELPGTTSQETSRTAENITQGGGDIGQKCFVELQSRASSRPQQEPLPRVLFQEGTWTEYAVGQLAQVTGREGDPPRWPYLSLQKALASPHEWPSSTSGFSSVLGYML